MYIDMVERIAVKQHKPSLIIEYPTRAPKMAKKFTFWPIYEKLVFSCTYVSTVMISAFADILKPPVPRGFYVTPPDLLTFWCPQYPWILCKPTALPLPRTPKKKEKLNLPGYSCFQF